MSMVKITVTVDTDGADEDSDPIGTVISNLEYDNFTVISYTVEEAQA